MGKRKIVLLFLSLFYLSAFSQDSVKWAWKVSSERKADGIYELTFSTPISAGWQLYSPQQDISGINSSELVFSDSSIQQQSPLAAFAETKKITSSIFDGQQFAVNEGLATWKATIKLMGQVPEKLLGTLKYTYGKGDEFYPLESYSFEVKLEGGVAVTNRIRIETVNMSAPVNDCGIEKTSEKSSLWRIFFLGFLGGLVALLTPCVFPMVPLTVSFFTKKTNDKKGTANAVLYGFFIFLIYVAFSIPFHLIGTVSPTIYNDISFSLNFNFTRIGIVAYPCQ